MDLVNVGGNWLYKEHIDINEYFGFVYKITNVITGHFYIGKKQFFKERKVKLKDSKRKIKQLAESDWKKYWGSSKEFINHKKKYKEENFKKEILFVCKNKTELTYYENFYIYNNHNMLNPLCFNKHIGNIYANRISDNKEIFSFDYQKNTPELNEIEIINKYKNGVKLYELSKEYKCGIETLCLIIPKEIREINRGNQNNKKWNENIIPIIQKLYNQGKPIYKIGEELNIDPASIRHILITHLQIDTSKRDLRTQRPKGLKTKPIKHIETGIIYNSILDASQKLNITRSIINRSLKENKTIQQKYTFSYI